VTDQCDVTGGAGDRLCSVTGGRGQAVCWCLQARVPGDEYDPAL